MYNKNQYRKFNDKKILHKVKKQWVTISLALLMMIGGGAVATHVSTNADTNNLPVAQGTPTKNIQNNANTLHKTLLTNAVNNNKATNNEQLNDNNTPTNNKESSNSSNVIKSSANDNLMSFNSADFNWNNHSSALYSDENEQFNNSSLTSLANEAVSYNNEFNSVSSSVSDAVSNISQSASDIAQSISDKLSDAKISSAQAKSMSQSVSASASSAEASEQKISSSVESEYNSASNAKNNVYASLCKSLDSSKYSNYLNLVNDRHVNPTFKDASIISSGTNYSPTEQQYIRNIHNQLSDLNKQSDQLDNILRKDHISDISMFNKNGGPVVSKKDLITNHPDALNAYRNLEINWVNFYRKMYNLPLVQESSELDNVAQQYAERDSDPDCWTTPMVGPHGDITGYFTDANNIDGNGLAGHRTVIINYESDIGIGANNGKNNHSDDTLLGGDRAGAMYHIKNCDYLKSYRNGRIGMNYAISYPKPGLFPYSDAKDAQQWSLWVPTLYDYTSGANSISKQYDPINNMKSYESDAGVEYFGSDTKVAVHDDTTNQDVNVSNITTAPDGEAGDADYICYVVDNNAIQSNHTYTITVSNIHNWQPHTFKYTTKLYNPNMSFPNSNNNLTPNQSSSSTNNASANSQSNNQSSAASQNNNSSSSEAPSSAQQPNDNTNSTPIPSFDIPSVPSTSVVTPTQNNTTSMSDNNDSRVVPSSEPQTTNTNVNTNTNINSQVSDSTKPTNKHHDTRIARNHHAKRGSIYLFNTDFKGLSKRNRSVVTIKGVRAYTRTRKGRYIPVKNIKPNTELAVKRVIKFGKITKLQLTNGWLVTSNKHFVSVKKFAKRDIKGINPSRYARALRKSNFVLRHGRRHATRYMYRTAKKFNRTNNTEKKAYRKFTRKHTNRNRKALNKVLTNLNNLVNALLK